MPLWVVYRDVRINAGRADLVVDEVVLVELKSVERLDPVLVSQVVSYLRASGLRLGLLVNFNTVALKRGLRRILR